MADIRTDEHLETQRSVAREYRRGGYDVMEQPRGDSLPAFLRGFAPDLIVMKDDDRAVVEIKTAEGLRGSNEIKELAVAIERHAGWRFELISLGARKDTALAGPSEDSLEHLLAFSLTAYDLGQRDLSLIYLVSVLDELVRDAAMRYRIKGRDRSPGAIIAELAFQGIIDGTTADVLDEAWDRRNAIVHGRPAAESPSREEFSGSSRRVARFRRRCGCRRRRSAVPYPKGEQPPVRMSYQQETQLVPLQGLATSRPRRMLDSLTMPQPAVIGIPSDNFVFQRRAHSCPHPVKRTSSA